VADNVLTSVLDSVSTSANEKNAYPKLARAEIKIDVPV
jgi:hypothetical protein